MVEGSSASTPSHRISEGEGRVVLTVDLPDLESMKDIVLDIGEASLMLSKHGKSFDISLPAPVVGRSKEAVAKFSKKKRQLTLSWPSVAADDEVAVQGSEDSHVSVVNDSAAACGKEVENIQNADCFRWHEENSPELGPPQNGQAQSEEIEASNAQEAEQLKAAENKQKADKFKAEANKEFTANNLRKAIELYTEAIDLYPDDHTYHANRAFAHIKLENFGSAIMDASTAIDLDPTFIKGFYRRATAYFSLGKLEESKADFTEAVKLEPQNKEARAKLAEVERAIKTQQFHKAVGCTADAWDARGNSALMNTPGLNPATIEVEASYSGPRLGEDSKLTLSFVEAMMEHFKQEKTLHKKYTLILLWQAHAVLQAETSVVDVPVPKGTHITVCGDVHGQYYDLVNIFNLNGMPSETNPYLFNGDFVDRGSFSVETILLLLAFKVLYPDSFHLNRGNHESVDMNKMYGFEGEVKAKCGDGIMTLFTDLFQWLPLAHVIGEKVLVVHGGLFSKDTTSLDDVRKISRHCEPPDEGPMHELLWSDPQPLPGRSPSKRGIGVSFGPDVAKGFLDRNGLSLLIRSHECKDGGYEVQHGGSTITVFSAPNYCDQMGNRGAFIRLDHTLKPKFTSFVHVPHPTVRPMQYAGMGRMNILNFLR